MAEGVLMPKEGITVESCIIGEWKKNVGDQVNVGDVLFSYETDKAEFECESTASGTLLAKFYEDGDEVPCLVSVCAVGNPGDEIAAFAKKRKLDIIVMGSHGYGRFKSAIMGSTATRIAASGDVPLLVIR